MRRSVSKKTARASARKSILAVTVLRAGNNRITQMSVSGHAGFAAAGRDVVCAGVSALVLSLPEGLSRFCGVEAHVRDEPQGDFVLGVAGGGNPKAQAVLETALAGLRAIARSYPGYVIVRERKVAHGNNADRIHPSQHRTRA